MSYEHRLNTICAESVELRRLSMMYKNLAPLLPLTTVSLVSRLIAKQEVNLKCLTRQRMVVSTSNLVETVTVSINRLDAIFKKAVRWKLTQDCHSFDQLLAQCDSRLFSQSTHTNHCLHHVFTYNNRSSLALRERGHPFELPSYKYDLTRKSFIMRALYEFL